MLNTSLGERVRKARKELGLTQHDLAKGIVTSSMICQIENGKAFPSYHVLESLAERLAKPIEYFVSDTDANLRQRSAYTLAKALLEAGSYEKAYGLLRSIEGSGQIEAEEFAMILSDCCQKLGRYDEATAPLDSMLSTAINQNNFSLAVTLLIRLGEISEAAGQYQLAIYHWRKAQDLIDRTELTGLDQVKLHLSLGTTYYRLGDIQESLNYLEQAYAAKESQLTFEEYGQMLLALSLTYHEQNNYEKATFFSDQALATLQGMNQVRLATEVKRSYGILLAKQGQFDDAVSMLNDCLDAYSDSNDAKNIAVTQIELAHVLHSTDEDHQAITLLVDALSQLDDEDMETARAHHLLAKAYRNTADVRGAIHHLHHALNLYQKHGHSIGMTEAMSLSLTLYEEWEKQRQHQFGTLITA